EITSPEEGEWIDVGTTFTVEVTLYNEGDAFAYYVDVDCVLFSGLSFAEGETRHKNLGPGWPPPGLEAESSAYLTWEVVCTSPGDTKIRINPSAMGHIGESDIVNIHQAPPPSQVWVDDDWAGLSPGDPADGHTFGYDAFATIQEGIDAVAGSTVNVANGTYSAISSPFVRITTDNLTLIGESRDGVILDGTGTSTIAWAKGIHVTANNVTIKNLTVQNFGAPGYWGYGVLFRDYAHDTPAEGYIYYSGGVVENVRSQNNCYPMYALVNQNLTIRNCLIQNNLGDGMFIARDCDNATITGNTVINSGDHGIWVGKCWMGLGPSDNATITNNTVDGAREGGITFCASDGATISGNTITNVAAEGWSVGALSLKDGPSNVEAYDNTIYNNDGSWGGYSGTGHGVGIDGTPSNIKLYHNCIYGNTGYGVYNYSTVLVMAENNWWGDASGPYDPIGTTEVPPCTAVPTTEMNADGIGDAVSDNVDYCPWLTGLTYTGDTLFASTTPVVLKATLSDSTDGAMGANVSFYVDDALVDSATTDANGVATLPIGLDVGVYAVKARAAGCLVAEALLAVYDPSAGFVTGGGWINSPSGAYMPSDTVVVTEANVGVDWFVADTRAAGTGTFIEGPGNPPLGTGSFEMTTTGSNDDKVQLLTDAYHDTLLREIDGMNYQTYRSSSSIAWGGVLPAINLRVDVDSDDVVDTYLVYEPYLNGVVPELDNWQFQDAYQGGDALWWSSHSIPGALTRSPAVPWSDIVAANPDARILEDPDSPINSSKAPDPSNLQGSFGVNLGSWNPSFIGAVDALTISVCGDAVTYDFEPVAPFDPTGKATFGFVSKYKKGASVPTGQTEFQFKVADLNFHSSSYDWLVITGGQKAMYKGTGTINGAGNYGFMLSATDADIDTFRIKIWDKDTGTTIYDNKT
ncbi:MAG: right-handed parallel beta-helix repeat-containing protein, partial [Candidatus Eisenbacteria sp.]|nr:right-handed parallel beta-helix repeat-containing protein [Candidatus Eisenbacteria bacterium]